MGFPFRRDANVILIIQFNINLRICTSLALPSVQSMLPVRGLTLISAPRYRSN